MVAADDEELKKKQGADEELQKRQGAGGGDRADS